MINNFLQRIVFLTKYYFYSKLFRKKFFKQQINHIVVYKYKFIYLSIPKVACSSLKAVFANLLNKNEGDVHDLNKFNFVEIENINDKRFEKYFKFAFVRNPWDRVVSLYLNKISNPLGGKSISHRGEELFYKYRWWKKSMSFKDFVIAISKTPDIYSELHFKSQHNFIYDKKGNLLADFIGRFENLDKDFDHVCRKINIPKVNIPHDNSTTRNHYSTYYNKETKKLIAERYKKDIRLFGYVFEDKKEFNIR